jgi:putative ABC transport system permease protein
MSLVVEDPPLVLGTGHGGMPARRAVTRWAWRLVRREWRQQSIIMALLLVAVAATTIGLGIASNAPSETSMFGTADHIVTLSSTGMQLDADVATLRGSFGAIDVIEHAKAIPVPGSANGVDLRAQDPDGPYARTMLRLNQGTWPHGSNEIAVTERVARIFSLRIGSTWNPNGTPRTVVGIVENPLNLNDAFVLTPPGQTGPVDHVDVFVKTSDEQFRAKPRPDNASVAVRSNGAGSANVVVLLLATIGLVFVGLLAVAGFTVIGQRRLRALGMLGAMGASHRHIRLVLMANGALIGAVGSLAGVAVGIIGWVALGPQLEPLLGHRIDRFNLPWTTVLTAVLLAVATAVIAAWWPARAAARIPVVAALSARPAQPRPAHGFAALGAVALVVGLGCLYLAKQTKPAFIIAGVLATAIALLLLAPVGITVIGRLAHFAPLAPRLAMRDLARYRARSGAALAAISLATGIAAAIAVAAAASAAKAAEPSGGNLPANQVAVWLSQAIGGPVPDRPATQIDLLRGQVDAMARDLHATSVLPLTGAVDPRMPLAHGGRDPMMLGKPHTEGGRTMYSSNDSIPLFVATPELLQRYGIDPASVAADTDLLTPRSSVDGYDLVPGRFAGWHPKLQHVTLPDYSSAPNVLLTTHAVTQFGFTTEPVGWLIEAPGALTLAQVDAAQQSAAAAGLYVESRPTGADQTRLAGQFTGVGIAVALGVLTMTVGLIRSETSRDLRTLTATGARRRTRRTLTAATASALAFAGAVIGTGCAYVALIAWYHQEVHWLSHPPVVNLLAMILGLPIVAYLGGYLLAGREAAAIARQPLD